MFAHRELQTIDVTLLLVAIFLFILADKEQLIKADGVFLRSENVRLRLSTVTTI